MPIGLAGLIARLFRPVPDAERAQAAVLEQIKRDVHDELRSAAPEWRVAFEAVEAFPLEHSAVDPFGQSAFTLFSSVGLHLHFADHGKRRNPGGLERLKDS